MPHDHAPFRNTIVEFADWAWWVVASAALHAARWTVERLGDLRYGRVGRDETSLRYPILLGIALATLWCGVVVVIGR